MRKIVKVYYLCGNNIVQIDIHENVDEIRKDENYIVIKAVREDTSERLGYSFVSTTYPRTKVVKMEEN